MATFHPLTEYPLSRFLKFSWMLDQKRADTRAVIAGWRLLAPSQKFLKFSWMLDKNAPTRAPSSRDGDFSPPHRTPLIKNAPTRAPSSRDGDFSPPTECSWSSFSMVHNSFWPLAQKRVDTSAVITDGDFFISVQNTSSTPSRWSPTRLGRLSKNASTRAPSKDQRRHFLPEEESLVLRDISKVKLLPRELLIYLECKLVVNLSTTLYLQQHQSCRAAAHTPTTSSTRCFPVHERHGFWELAASVSQTMPFMEFCTLIGLVENRRNIGTMIVGVDAGPSIKRDKQVGSKPHWLVQEFTELIGSLDSIITRPQEKQTQNGIP
ncbi:hypothetical protein B0H13DRAFT_2532079 [Mycena leptocephala]|nr:hypothetical protein B0H13DRAFT_2532079 [Mycena leptocephala]